MQLFGTRPIDDGYSPSILFLAVDGLLKCKSPVWYIVFLAYSHVYWELPTSKVNISYLMHVWRTDNFQS